VVLSARSSQPEWFATDSISVGQGDVSVHPNSMPIPSAGLETVELLMSKEFAVHPNSMPIPSAGLETVELLMSKEFAGQNRGFCFLEFYNHACAQAAKAALSPPQFQCVPWFRCLVELEVSQVVLL
jgi:hypothetical protein